MVQEKFSKIVDLYSIEHVYFIEKYMNELKTNRQIEPQYYYQDVKSNEKTQWVEKTTNLSLLFGI